MDGTGRAIIREANGSIVAGSWNLALMALLVAHDLLAHSRQIPNTYTASQMTFTTTPSTLVYTNGQLLKSGDTYYDPDGQGSISGDLNTGG